MGLSGEVLKTAAVTTNDPKKLSFQLILRFYVKADPKTTPPNLLPTMSQTVGPFGVTPNTKWITGTLSGTKSKGEISLYNNTPSPINIKQITPGGDSILVTLQTIEKGKRYVLSMETREDLKPGRYTQTVHVLTDNKEHPDVEIPMEATVYPLVNVNPPSLNLGEVSLSGGNPSPMTIVVRKVKSLPLKILDLKSSLPFVTLDVSADTTTAPAANGQRPVGTSSLYRIKLTLDRSKAPGAGPFKGTINIATDDAERPSIEIPVTGSFVK